MVIKLETGDMGNVPFYFQFTIMEGEVLCVGGDKIILSFFYCLVLMLTGWE